MDLHVDPALASLVAGVLAFLRSPTPPAWLDGRTRVLAVAVVLGALLAVATALGAGQDWAAAIVRGAMSGASSVLGMSALGYVASKARSDVAAVPVLGETGEVIAPDDDETPAPVAKP